MKSIKAMQNVITSGFVYNNADFIVSQLPEALTNNQNVTPQCGDAKSALHGWKAPIELVKKHIFPYLSQQDLARTSGVCRAYAKNIIPVLRLMSVFNRLNEGSVIAVPSSVWQEDAEKVKTLFMSSPVRISMVQTEAEQRCSDLRQLRRVVDTCIASELFTLATQAASKYSIGRDVATSFGSLRLFKALIRVKHVKAYQEATKAAISNAGYVDSPITCKAISLFQGLVEANHAEALQPATEAAAKYFANCRNYKKIERNLLFLFQALLHVNHAPAFQAAPAAASRGFADYYLTVRQNSLTLFRSLFNANYTPGFQAATEAACKNFASTDPDIGNSCRQLALDLFEDLFKANHAPAFQAAATLASTYVTHHWHEHRHSSLVLYTNLVKAGHSAVFQTATNVAAKRFLACLDDIGRYEIGLTLKLFRALFKAKHRAAFQVANELASQYVSHISSTQMHRADPNLEKLSSALSEFLKI